MFDLFENVKIDNVLSLQETGLYQKTWLIEAG